MKKLSWQKAFALIIPKEITPLSIKTLSVTLLLVFISTISRLWPLHILESKLAWLTYYPTVMASAIYGGLWAGLIATFSACIILIFFWSLIAHTPFITNQADWVGVIVFVFTGTMISLLAEAMLKANRNSLKAKREAQLASQAKDTFLANMSHELRTPLNAILGYAQVMHDETPLDSKHREYLQIINRSGEHLLALINEVLEISKIEANRLTLNLSSFDLHLLISDIKKMFELKANTKNILFDFTGLEQVPQYVNADEIKLRIIFINLLGNAFKFTDNGSITVRLSSEISEDQTNFLIAEITDTGPGIEEEDLNNIFHYFIQSESGKSKQSGTGLGLSISQDYAKIMNGQITVKSKINVGSTFTLKIKIEKTSQSSLKESASTKKVTGIFNKENIPKILIAEDTIESRVLLEKILTDVGFNVKSVTNGKEAVEAFQEWHPDFIWMDLRMPIMSGLDAIKIIRNIDKSDHTKIVTLSAHLLGNEKQEVLNAGSNDFLAKPFKTNDIFTTMKKYLPIEYLYSDVNTPIKTDDFLLDEECIRDLKLLEDKIFNEIKNAAKNTNAIKIAEIAKVLKTTHPKLANALLQCASNFDYSVLQSLNRN